MRKLKLDEPALLRLLNELDVHDPRIDTNDHSNPEYYSYRIPALRVDVDVSRDQTASHMVPSRKLGPRGVFFLVGSLMHKDCPCRVHLVTVRNNWQTVAGKVESCRYIPGSSGVHEVSVRFNRPIDPASFAATATRSRILAVDDSAVSRKLYERLLDTMNVDLETAENGLEATELAMSGTYDLVLMDLEMPVMDGLTAVKLLRSKGFVRAIVAASAMTTPEDRQRCLDAGCDDFLEKPVSRETLADVVHRNKSEPLVSAMLDDPSMADLIDNFVAGLAEAINRLEAAYGSQNRDDLERETRALKGEAAGIGFNTITDAAAGVEEAIKRGDEIAGLRGRLTELIRLCMSARPATSRQKAEAVAQDAAEQEAQDKDASSEKKAGGDKANAEKSKK
jgi:CheY-like chemotaxis protein